MYQYIFDLGLNTISSHCIRRTADGAVIPFDPNNTDYRRYMLWLEEGNVPIDPDPTELPDYVPPEPPVDSGSP